MSPTSATTRLSPDSSERDALLAKLADAHRKLANDDHGSTTARLVLMLTAVAEHLPLDRSELIKSCETRLNSAMEMPFGDEVVPWCLEQLKEAISSSPQIESRYKNRALHLIDVFGDLTTFCGLVQFYRDLENLKPFGDSYRNFSAAWASSLAVLFEAQLDLALTRHPNSLKVINTVREIAVPVLGSSTVIELVLGLKRGNINSMEQLARRWHDNDDCLKLSAGLRQAVADLKAAEVKARAERLPSHHYPATAHLGPVLDPSPSGNSSF